MSQFPCPFCSSLISGDALICRVCGYRLKIDKGIAGTEAVNDQYRIPQWQVDQRFEQQFPGSLSKRAPRADKKRFRSRKRATMPGSIQSWENAVSDNFSYQPPRGNRNALLNLSFIFLVIFLAVFSAVATDLLQTFTYILPAIILLICLFITLITFTSPQLKQDFALNPYIMWRTFQPYRFISAGFSHINVTHLALNAFSIFSFGPYLLEGLVDYFGDFGPLVFTLFFIISIVAADIPDLLWHRNNPYYSSVGASGGGASIIAATVVLFPDITVYSGIPGTLFVIVYFIVSVALAFRKNSQLAHLAHATGTAFGVVLALALSSTSGGAESLGERLTAASGVSWSQESATNYADQGFLNIYTLDGCAVWEIADESSANSAAEGFLNENPSGFKVWVDESTQTHSWVVLLSTDSNLRCAQEASDALGWAGLG